LLPRVLEHSLFVVLPSLITFPHQAERDLDEMQLDLRYRMRQDLELLKRQHAHDEEKATHAQARASDVVVEMRSEQQAPLINQQRASPLPQRQRERRAPMLDEDEAADWRGDRWFVI
jgi:hypothetical protein